MVHQPPIRHHPDTVAMSMTEQAKADELKVCPFCGGGDIISVCDDGLHWNRCNGCGATGPETTRYSGEEGTECIDWNTRPDPPTTGDDEAFETAWNGWSLNRSFTDTDRSHFVVGWKAALSHARRSAPTDGGIREVLEESMRLLEISEEAWTDKVDQDYVRLKIIFQALQSAEPGTPK